MAIVPRVTTFLEMLHWLPPVLNPDFGWVFIVYFLSVGLIGVIWQPEMSRPLSTESPRTP